MPVPMDRVPFALTPAGRAPMFTLLLLGVLAMTAAAMVRAPANGADSLNATSEAPQEAVGSTLPSEATTAIVFGAAGLVAVGVIVARARLRPRA